MKKHDLRRRRFLQTSATGAGALALLGFLEACKQRTFNKEKSGTLADSSGTSGVRVRKSWTTLSTEEKDLYKQAVALLHAETISGKPYKSQFQRLAYIHENSCPHGNWFFLPWHRAYLALYESELVRVLRKNNVTGADTFALPYWNWTETPAIPDEFNNTTLDPVVLYKGDDEYEVPRNPPATYGGRMPERAVGAAAIARTLRPTDFYQFACYPSENTNFANEDFRAGGSLEAIPHNTVHGTIGGHMGAFLSPLDPIFWLHHCNVDRLWNEWMKDKTNVLPYQPETASVAEPLRNAVVDMVISDASGKQVADYRQYWLDYQFRLDAGPRSASDMLHQGAKASDMIDSTKFTLEGVADSRGFRYDTDPAAPPSPVAEWAKTPRSTRKVSRVAFKEQVRATSDTTFAARISAEEAKDVLAAFAKAVAAGKQVGAFIVVQGIPVPTDAETRNAVQVMMRVADADTADKAADARGEIGAISFFSHTGKGEHAGHAKDKTAVSLDITEWLKTIALGSPVKNVWISGAYEKKPGLTTAPQAFTAFKDGLSSRLKDAKDGINFTLVVRAEA